MFEHLFFVRAAGDEAPTLTVAGLPLCVIPKQANPAVGAIPHSSSLDDGLDYFQAQGAAARERLAR